MKRRLLILIAFLVLLAGWLSAFTATGFFGRSSVHLLLPALLLGVGLGLLLKLTNIRQTVLTLALSAILALVGLNYVVPQHTPRLSALQRLKPTVYSSPIQVRATESTGVFAVRQSLQSYRELDIKLFSVLPGVARNMVFCGEGDGEKLFVSLPDLGAIYLLGDSDGDGFADVPQLYHVGMERPTGMACVDGRLYVAEPARVLELKGDLQMVQERVVVDGLPDDGGHWMRGLVADGQGQLYLTIGSRCNACEEADRRRATMQKIDLATGEVIEYARGLRNSVALAWSPFDGSLWGADISRQAEQGMKLPPDELNRIVEGGDYGWPFCFGQQRIDPFLGNPERCQQTLPAQVDLPPLSAPISMAFDDNFNDSKDNQDGLYIVNSGFGRSLLPPDYKVVKLPFRKGQPAEKTADFLWGWYQQNEGWGKPIAIAISNQGVIFLSDEQNKVIYRITEMSRER